MGKEEVISPEELKLICKTTAKDIESVMMKYIDNEFKALIGVAEICWQELEFEELSKNGTAKIESAINATDKNQIKEFVLKRIGFEILKVQFERAKDEQ